MSGISGVREIGRPLYRSYSDVRCVPTLVPHSIVHLGHVFAIAGVHLLIRGNHCCGRISIKRIQGVGLWLPECLFKMLLKRIVVQTSVRGVHCSPKIIESCLPLSYLLHSHHGVDIDFESLRFLFTV